MTEPTPSTPDALAACLAVRGMDVCAPFRVADYNALVHARWMLPELVAAPGTSVAVVVGSTKGFWPHFVAWLRQQVELPSDPIDAYATTVVEESLASLALRPGSYAARHAWASPRLKHVSCAHMQTAGHVAGVAYYDRDTFWSIHKDYGVWFVFRAVVVFQVDAAHLPRHPTTWLPSDHPLTAEERAEIARLTAQAIDECWTSVETLLQIRLVPQLGQQHAYSGDLLDYFYPVRRTRAQVLHDVLHRAGDSAGDITVTDVH